MRPFYLISLAVLAALGLGLLPPSPARAEETTCQGSLPAVTVDNLRVPAEAVCTLTGTTVLGTLKVEAGASLTARRLVVAGNLQAEGARLVRVLAGSVISGSVQIKESGAARIHQAHVHGDIQFDANPGPVSATRTQVGGNVQVFQNLAGVTLAGNTIDGNLQCQGNPLTPAGGNNVVHGNAEGQCASLAALETTPPETVLLEAPAARGLIAFSGHDDLAPQSLLVFECALDGAAFTACVSPYHLPDLAAGPHTLRIRALDLALNADVTPASHTWTAAGPAPFTVFLPAVLRPAAR